MVKKSIGCVVGCLLIAAFTGYGSGCSSTTTTNGPTDSGAAADGSAGDGGGNGGTCPAQDPNPAPYRPPLSHAGLCTEAQMTGFVQSCTGTATRAACDAFLGDTNNADCLKKCIFLDPQGGDAPNYGPSIANMVNVAGYMELKGASKTCAEARHLRDLCLYIACLDCTSADDEGSCRVSASSSGGVCESQEAAHQQGCTGAADQAAAKAFEDDDAADRATILRAFCGGAISDAGADG
jgi:hypothetical protein